MKKQSKSKPKTEKVVNEEAELLKSQLVRTLADYDNLVKRVEREKSEIQKIVSLRLILRLLTVLDGLENAQIHLKDTGLAISIVEFKKILSEEGLTEVSPKIGEEFDEQTMEAIEVVPGASDNSVAEVVLMGWKFEDPASGAGDTVVRHAKVTVSKRSS
jgi:molecular chaperone GrpE